MKTYDRSKEETVDMYETRVSETTLQAAHAHSSYPSTQLPSGHQHQLPRNFIPMERPRRGGVGPLPQAQTARLGCGLGSVSFKAHAPPTEPYLPVDSSGNGVHVNHFLRANLGEVGMLQRGLWQ